MPNEVPVEMVELMTRFAGSLAGSVEEFLMAYYASQNPGAQGKFPFTRPEQHMPMFSDLIVFGLQLPPWLIGLLAEDDAKKRGDTKTADIAKAVKQFGEGGVLYTGPKTTKNTIIHNIPAKAPGAPAGQNRLIDMQRSQTARGIVYQL